MGNTETKPDKDLLAAVSSTVAEYLNKDIDLESLIADLEDTFDDNMSAGEKMQVIEQAQVRCVSCYEPGYLPDNEPWFLAASGNVRETAINEVASHAAEAYEEDKENQGAWNNLLERLIEAPDGDFSSTVTIDMPNGCRIGLEPVSCLEALNLNGVKLEFNDNLKNALSDKELMDSISKIFVEQLNHSGINADDLQAELAEILPEELTSDEKLKVIDDAHVLCVTCYRPGEVPDIGPGWLPSDANIREAVIDEIESYADVHEEDENHAAWQDLLEDLKNSEDETYAESATVDMPDGLRLKIEPFQCWQILNESKVELDFAENDKPNP